MLVHKRETVYERSKRNGGFITGPQHPIMKVVNTEAKEAKASPTKSPSKKGMGGDESLNARRDKVQDALKDLIPKSKSKKGDDADGPSSSYPWIRDISEDVVIFDQDGDTYGATYSINSDGEVSLSKPYKVAQQWTPQE